MKHLSITYNTPLDKIIKEENIKSINKNFLSIEDLDIIDNHYQKYSFIEIKNDKLIKRKDFDIDKFYNSFVLQHPEIDIFILSSYGEKCQDLKEIDTFEDYKIFESKIPHQIESFIIKNEEWKKVKELMKSSKEEKINNKLKNLIYQEELKASFTWPQVYYQNSNNNFLNICRQEKDSFITPRIKEISYYWFTVTFLFSVIFIYIVYDRMPKDRFFYLK